MTERQLDVFRAKLRSLEATLANILKEIETQSMDSGAIDDRVQQIESATRRLRLTA